MAAFLYAPARATAAGAQTWLVVSDVHLDPFDRRKQPSLFGSDTNLALFRSALAEMRRRVPDPAAVLLPGDFFAHDFARRARRGGELAGDAAGLETMHFIAGAFARAYPHAHFAVALGNNDAPCGDYHTAFGTRFADAIARIWEPLVNRGGEASAFAASFAANGSYAANSPLPGTRFVVFDDVPLSTMYRGNCADGTYASSETQLRWLRATLASTPSGTTNVVLMHVPPGYDVFSTEITRGYFPWPFLDAGASDALLSAFSNGANHVSFVVAGHEHRFDFRLADDVPYVVFGSLSPVYHNNPAFYALDVSADGSPRDVRAFTFDEWTQSWQPARSFDAKWGTASLDAASLGRLHARLGRDAALRHAWDAASSGWPSNWKIAWGTWGNWWRVPWCAQVYLDGEFTACAGLSVRAELFRAALAAIAAGAGLSIVGLALLPARPRRAKRDGTNEC
jgi:hypothetical protein